LCTSVKIIEAYVEFGVSRKLAGRVEYRQVANATKLQREKKFYEAEFHHNIHNVAKKPPACLAGNVSSEYA
jgi:hypothetical protein